MLMPRDVLPFLEHEDPDLRHQALSYLTDASDPAPATADDLWRAIDRFGLADPDVNWPMRLGELPETEASVERLLGVVSAADGSVRARRAACLALLALDYPLLSAKWDAIRDAPNLPAHVRERLAERVALAETPPEQVWERLHAHARVLNDPQASTDLHVQIASDLIAEVARHPTMFAARVLAGLRDESINDARLLHYVDLAGRMWLHDAIDSLIDCLHDDDDDELNDEAVRALTRIGTLEVVEKLVVEYREGSEFFQMSAADVIGHIKRPESVRALMSLLQRFSADDHTDEADSDRSTIALSLVRLCPNEPEALELLRWMVVEKRYDPQHTDLKADLATLATMVGYAPPELAEWKAHARGQQEKTRKLIAEVAALDEGYESRWMRGETFVDRLPDEALDDWEYGDKEGDDDAYDLGPPLPFEPDYTPVGTIRREGPKIGRNDPCPCGSGKKYKKCCGANA